MFNWLFKVLAQVVTAEVDVEEKLGGPIAVPDFDLISTRHWETSAGEYTYLGENGGCWLDCKVVYKLRVFVHCDRRKAELLRKEMGRDDKQTGRGKASQN